MESKEREMIEYTFEQISSIDIKLVEDFSCGAPELDEKLKQMSQNDEGTTYVFLDNVNNKIIGYCTFSTSGLRLSYQHDSITHPAAEIKYFAISKDYQHKPYKEGLNFSDLMMCEIIKRLIDISENTISFDYILLYSVKQAVNFYERNGFYKFTEYMNRDSYNYIDGCIPMFYEL